MDHGQWVLCSGAYETGSLRGIYNGVSIKEEESVELKGIKRMWFVISECYNGLLVLSFMDSTLFFEVHSEKIEQLITAGDFVEESETFFCGNVIHDQIIQVTAKQILLLKSSSAEKVTDLLFEEKITVATAKDSLVLVAHGKDLVLVHVADSELQIVKEVVLDECISCLDMLPGITQSVAAVGMWVEMSIRLFSIPNLTQTTISHLGRDGSPEYLPRCIIMFKFNEETYLLCGLANGYLLSFSLDARLGKLLKQREIKLGLDISQFCLFKKDEKEGIFIASDRPTMVWESENSLTFSDINLKEASCVCPLTSIDKLAVYTGDKLLVCGVEEMKRSVPYHTILSDREVSNVCYLKRAKAIACCYMLNGNYFVGLLDDQNPNAITSYALNEPNCTLSMTSYFHSENEEELLCVGTGISDVHEPKEGCILVFKVAAEGDKRSINLVTKEDVDGAVYSLKEFEGNLLCSVNSTIRLYKWSSNLDGLCKLKLGCEVNGRFIALSLQTNGDLIAAGDLIGSIAIFAYKGEEIKLLGIDSTISWLTAFDFLGDDLIVGADSFYNIFVMRWNATDSVLERVGEYNIGDMINIFRRGVVSKYCPHLKLRDRPTIYFGTISGSIGVIMSISHDSFIFAKNIENCIIDLGLGRNGILLKESQEIPQKFVDGDAITPVLSNEGLLEHVSMQMNVPKEKIYSKVLELVGQYSSTVF